MWHQSCFFLEIVLSILNNKEMYNNKVHLIMKINCILGKYFKKFHYNNLEIDNLYLYFVAVFSLYV